MTIWAAKLSVDGVAEFFDRELSVPEIQEIVGGWFASARGPHGDVVFVDDEGLLKGLEVNHAASFVALGSHLVGDAVVVGPVDRNGDNLPLTDQVVDFIGTICKVLD